MSSTYITQQDDGRLVRTAEGEAYLAKTVTNTEGDVYSFYDTIEPAIVAAAMARLSRFGGDMRELILKEFADRSGHEAALLRRVLTQFGDDSVAQLSYVPVVVENASNLLTKQLERGRLAAYLEQSTRYIYYDQKRDGKYRYHIPSDLPPKLRQQYVGAMDAIFDCYSEVVHKLREWFEAQDETPKAERDVAWRIAIRGKACDVARGLLPGGTTSTVGVVGSAQAIDNLIMHLLAQDLPEAQVAGKRILQEVRKQHAIFFERTDMPDRGEATVTYMQQTRRQVEAVAAKKLPKTQAEVRSGVTLLDSSPIDELELLTHMLYPSVSLGFRDLQKEIANWTPEEQSAVFGLYMGQRKNRRHKPGRALEVARYSFEIISDYGVFRDLQRHRMVDAIDWQKLNPYLGYEVPDVIKEAGLQEAYQKAHQQSQALYEALQTAGFELESQYAVLFDQRIRWKVTMNARTAFHLVEIRSQPAAHPGCRVIAQQMHSQISKVHPLIGQAMVFLNREANNPSISRLAQNKQAAAKLKALGLDGLIED